MAESDEEQQAEDNSLGRLLTLSDGIFAIAMTLLALDLKVPTESDLKSNPSNLPHWLGTHSGSYFAFLVSFYVVANYWRRHRRLMRSVVKFHVNLSRDTMALLLIVAAMPFFASVLGEYGGVPFSLALYGAANALAILFLLILTYDVRRYELLDPRAGVDDVSHWRESLATLGVFLLCIPGAYVLKSHGPWILVLLAVPVRLPGFLHRFQAFLRRRRSANNPTV